MNDKMPRKKARQGREGFPILLVLIASLVMAGIVWAIVEIYGVVIDENQPVETEQSTETPVDGPQGLEQQD
ncbi:hypothetical protein [Chelativorans sp. YIM 93263]|uniref:hypothetical protein n=1 Tax=Chelativorans sp. YIM 93263 TaxID=2906648 RepID=UPI002378B318|nr:hypothetical protein [Chelativorans sp. YIM 93263]